MIPTLPAHYGSRGAAWPPGEYWLIEHHRDDAPTLYWADDYDHQGRTGWSHLASSAAGFASKEDAEAAFAQRGKMAVEGGEVFVRAHAWMV